MTLNHQESDEPTQKYDRQTAGFI